MFFTFSHKVSIFLHLLNIYDGLKIYHFSRSALKTKKCFKKVLGHFFQNCEIPALSILPGIPFKWTKIRRIFLKYKTWKGQNFERNFQTEKLIRRWPKNGEIPFLPDRYSTIGLISTYLDPSSKELSYVSSLPAETTKNDHPLYISGDFNQADSAFSDLWNDLFDICKGHGHSTKFIHLWRAQWSLCPWQDTLSHGIPSCSSNRCTRCYT